MNKLYDDQKIAADFQQLKQLESAHTPRFSRVLGNIDRHRPRFSMLQPSAGIAFAALVLTVFIFALSGLDYPGKEPDMVTAPVIPESSIDAGIIDEMPTDFLLDTPWSQLASLETLTPLIELPDEFLEDRPDES